MFVGEDGERSGSAGFVFVSEGGRIEIRAEQAFAGGCLLDLGDDGRRAGQKRGAKVAARGLQRRGSPLVFGMDGRYTSLPLLAGDNSSQDVGNGVSQNGAFFGLYSIQEDGCWILDVGCWFGRLLHSHCGLPSAACYCLIAGVLAGMFGIGGGLIIVPALLFFVKMQELEAIGTSLAALIPPVGLLGG